MNAPESAQPPHLPAPAPAPAHAPAPSPAPAAATDRAGALDRRLLLAGAGLLGAAALTRSAAAGPLTPPAGPVTATPGPEPRTPVNAVNTPSALGYLHRITQPGSYYLERNLVGDLVAPLGGIIIDADGVDLDLNGFSVSGTSGLGILVSSTRVGVSIRNGSIRGWPGNAVSAASVVGLRIANLAINNCGGVGINAGPGAVIEGCTIRSVGGQGIIAGDGAVIDRCSVAQPTGTGFQLGSFCTVSRCVCIGASGAGADGFLASGASTFEACIANSNADAGFTVNTNSLLRNCLATSNADGFRAGTATTFIACTASTNSDDGFFGGALARDCVASANGGDGFEAVDSITGCVALNNTGRGVFLGSYWSVRDSYLRGNDDGGLIATGAYGHATGNFLPLNGLAAAPAPGLSVQAYTRVENNTVVVTEGDGIVSTGSAHVVGNFSAVNDRGLVSGSGARLEGNTVMLNSGDGIAVTGSDSYIGNNFANANTTQYNIAAGNGAGLLVTDVNIGATTNPAFNMSF